MNFIFLLAREVNLLLFSLLSFFSFFWNLCCFYYLLENTGFICMSILLFSKFWFCIHWIIYVLRFLSLKPDNHMPSSDFIIIIALSVITSICSGWNFYFSNSVLFYCSSMILTCALIDLSLCFLVATALGEIHLKC